MNNISVDDYAAGSNKNNETGNYFNNLDKIINNLQPQPEIPKTKKISKFLKKTAIISFITFISILFSLLVFYGFKKIKPVQIKNITIDKLWQYKTLSSIYSSPLIIDINNDNINDILINSMDGKLYSIDGISGKRLFYFETENPILSSPAILKKSRKEKWVILAGQDNTIYAIDKNNHCVWSTIKQDLDSPIISTPIITKINHDNIPDVIAAARDGKIYAFDGDRGWLIWKSRETIGDFFSTPLLININNDSIKDIVIGSPEKKIYGIDGKTGFKIWETSSSGSISSSPVLYDKSTIFIGDEDGILYKINGKTGNIISRVPLNAPIISTPVIIDTKICSSIVIPLSDGTIKAINTKDFNIIWEYNTKYQDPFTASPALVDVNKDNYQDIIITSRNGYLYIIDGNDGKDLMEPYFTGNSISSSPMLADINNDGFLEIIFGSENGYILAYTLKTVPGKIIKKNKIVYGTFLNR